MEIQEDEGKPRWLFTRFYGALNVRNKTETWDLLRRLGRNNSLPWLVGGDFNDILFAHEKQGGIPREEARMEAFRRTLEDCLLEDIGFSGPWFTWEMGRILEWNIRERIDRGVAMDTWLQNFPTYSLRHLPHFFSDHCPLLFEMEELNGDERSEETLAELMKVKLHLNMEMDKEERYWEHRARVNWLQMGDKNTSFFQKCASQRRRIN
ncbi:reverse transcriptase [Gossypium australe]|uniref:Reverse transcriptase n=1 Tax=Gossypium australe TaxID=47621 RepID=A0A5B6W7N6_9ROSI|nr:reverse transcriptase [Gossypium australe]